MRNLQCDNRLHNLIDRHVHTGCKKVGMPFLLYIGGEPPGRTGYTNAENTKYFLAEKGTQVGGLTACTRMSL